MHSARKLNDGYLGSGTILRRSLYKHGKENHRIEILQYFESKEDLTKAEEFLITEDVLRDPLCMNLKCGGRGGMRGLSKETIKRISDAGHRGHKIKILNDPDYKKRLSAACKLSMFNLHQRFKSGEIKRPIAPNWTGRKHKIETLEKFSKIHLGSNNSQFGTMWITDGFENKKVKCDSIVPDNWRKGRVLSKL